MPASCQSHWEHPGIRSAAVLPCIWQRQVGTCPAPKRLLPSQAPCMAQGLHLVRQSEYLLVTHRCLSWELSKRGAPIMCCWGEGNQQHQQGSPWACGTSNPQQNTSMCAFPLPACQSCFINPLAGMNVAVPTSVLSCLPTISMSSHKIKSNYEQIPAPRSPSPS